MRLIRLFAFQRSNYSISHHGQLGGGHSDWHVYPNPVVHGLPILEEHCLVPLRCGITFSVSLKNMKTHAQKQPSHPYGECEVNTAFAGCPPTPPRAYRSLQAY